MLREITGIVDAVKSAFTAETDAPIGFDETPPEDVTPEEPAEDTETNVSDADAAHAFPCRDHVPRTIVPPLTNGGMLRSMDNNHLAMFLTMTIQNGGLEYGICLDAWLKWLNEPCARQSKPRPPDSH